ncbi:MAG: YwaF family protein [Lachnospiraceae bacterium]|nr:YwaF family protein [Lachnospiraceae bacterium]
MFSGAYHFFDYKYNIEGYTGQDFGGPAQYIYLAVSLVLIALLAAVLRKRTHEQARRTVGFLGIFLTLFYLGKTAWESYYDILRFGAFNTGLLPFDTCSLIMPAAILTGFGKGKVQRYAECWVTTGGILGGLSNLLFLNALKYYPALTFGALYSMIWHFLMMFMGVLLIVSERGRLSFSRVLEGYLFHFLASVPVIAVDFLFDFDFMLYRNLGGVPFFEGVAGQLTAQGLRFLNPLLMLGLYFLAFCLIFGVSALVKNRKKAVPAEESPAGYMRPAA